jgi:hypothetical protein
MRIRVSFEFGAGVCLWADDAEARERWVSAVEFGDLPAPAKLVREGEALMDECSAAFFLENNEVRCRWTDAEQVDFHARAADWSKRLAAENGASGITVAEYGAEPEAVDDGPGFEGCVMVCFADEKACAAANEKDFSSFTWRETATWSGDTFKFRQSERSPAEFLARMEKEPGFVCGWWQASEGGTDAMLEGDPVEHAVDCVRARNATGLANFLAWLRVERVHLGDALAGESWVPTTAHRAGDAKGSWWEWVCFLSNATKALKGGRPSARYLRAEKERLLLRWTHGGSRNGWPATWGEAFERIGLQRESFNRWAK